MIWLKEKDKITGYVPILKKEYTEEEIRRMSEYSCYQGWSKLSSLVMKIQGIGFLYNGGFRDYYEVVAQKRVDVSFGFEFECFILPNDPRMEYYIGQIFEVFDNLTLYKIKELSEKAIKKDVAKLEKKLEPLISTKTTLWAIDSEVSSFIKSAESSYKNLSKLQKLFTNKGYVLKHDLFANGDEIPVEDIYERRNTKIMLKMSIYDD